MIAVVHLRRPGAGLARREIEQFVLPAGWYEREAGAGRVFCPRQQGVVLGWRGDVPASEIVVFVRVMAVPDADL